MKKTHSLAVSSSEESSFWYSCWQEGQTPHRSTALLRSEWFFCSAYLTMQERWANPALPLQAISHHNVHPASHLDIPPNVSSTRLPWHGHVADIRIRVFRWYRTSREAKRGKKGVNMWGCDQWWRPSLLLAMGDGGVLRWHWWVSFQETSAMLRPLFQVTGYNSHYSIFG